MIALFLAVAVAASAARPADLALAGTIVSPRPDRSVAILRSGGRSRTVTAGETAFGGKIVSIAPGLVTVDFGPERVELRLAGAGQAMAPPPPIPRADTAVAPRSMARSDVERRLGQEIPRILAETTVLPYLEQGEVAGLLLARMPEGLLSEAGLRPGDVLKSLNDVSVDSVATLASLWPRFQNATEVHAVVLRDGRPLFLTLSLR